MLYGQNMNDDTDTVYHQIIATGTTVAGKPSDMLSRNCSDCHVGNIFPSMMYYMLLSDTLQAKDKIIHSWLTCETNDTLREIHVQAWYINGSNDTLPVKKAMVLVMIKRYFGYMHVHQEPFLTDESGMVTIPFPGSMVGDTTGSLKLLIRLADQTSYPNAKLRISKLWAEPISSDVYSERVSIFPGITHLNLFIPVVFGLGTLTICLFLGYTVFLLLFGSRDRTGT
jgi:hypothetical protein